MDILKRGNNGLGSGSSPKISNSEEVECAVDDSMNPEDSLPTDPHQQRTQEVIIEMIPRSAVTEHEELNKLCIQLHMVIQVYGEMLKATMERLSGASHKHVTNAALPAVET